MKAQQYEPVNDLYHQYENYKDASFTQRRFGYAQFSRALHRLQALPGVKCDSLGASVEGRTIYGIKIGAGALKVMLWSQMHGDEPTATMAIFDLLNFLTADDNNNQLRRKILDSISLLILPGVNPDGMEKDRRRNALEIDINRDAVRLESPESNILMNAFLEFKPDVAFNLHDQSPRYTAGVTHRTAVLSLLAPAFNYEKERSPNRDRAMQVCAHINNVLSAFIPGHIAKYTDDFEPRAFGDNFQKLGAATVLIESGGWKNDPEKQFIRKMNFLAFVSSLFALAENRISRINLEDYDKIPFNEKYLFDVLLRKLTYTKNDTIFTTDVAFNLNESFVPGRAGYKVTSTIEDAGDLSTFYGNLDYDLSGFQIEAGKIYPEVFNTVEDVSGLSYDTLYRKGYIYIMVKESPEGNSAVIPPVIIAPQDFDKKERKNYLIIGNAANFIITRDKQVRYVVVNGSLYDTRLNSGEIRSGLLIK
ncbi:MAG: peptidase M14 [Ignavibacteriaceae bacterium]|nr:peptidase M14 [Ignavibacteriaceae bacterium]